jgi:hypothetical protein
MAKMHGNGASLISRITGKTGGTEDSEIQQG